MICGLDNGGPARCRGRMWFGGDCELSEKLLSSDPGVDILGPSVGRPGRVAGDCCGKL